MSKVDDISSGRIGIYDELGGFTPYRYHKIPFETTESAADIIHKSFKGSTLKSLKNGYKIEIPNPKQAKRPIIIRIMNEGSGGRTKPYFRVSVDGKSPFTLDAAFSNDRALTHIDMTDGFNDQIKSIIDKYIGG